MTPAEKLKELCEKNPKVKKEILDLLKKWDNTELVPGHYLMQAVKFLERQCIDPNLVHVEFNLQEQKMAIINCDNGEITWRTALVGGFK